MTRRYAVRAQHGLWTKWAFAYAKEFPEICQDTLNEGNGVEVEKFLRESIPVTIRGYPDQPNLHASVKFGDGRFRAADGVHEFRAGHVVTLDGHAVDTHTNPYKGVQPGGEEDCSKHGALEPDVDSTEGCKQYGPGHNGVDPRKLSGTLSADFRPSLDDNKFWVRLRPEPLYRYGGPARRFPGKAKPHYRADCPLPPTRDWHGEGSPTGELPLRRMLKNHTGVSLKPEAKTLDAEHVDATQGVQVVFGTQWEMQWTPKG